MSVELKALHDQLHTAINEIDDKLDSQADATTAGKRKITNDLIAASESTWKNVSDGLISQLKEAPEDIQIGVYYGLIRSLQSEFGENLSKAVAAKVEAAPKTDVPKLSDEEISALSATRSELYGKLKNLIETAKNFGLDAGMEMAKKRTGKMGKRGPRAISFFNWTVDTKAYDKLKDVIEDYPQYERVGELTKAMRAAGLNLTEPGDRLEFTLPDGKILVGVKDESKVPAPEEDEADDSADEEAQES